MILGIDFGTCFSSVSVMKGLSPVNAIVDDFNGLGIPSEFLYHDSKNYYGLECRTGNALAYRADIVTNMKKMVRQRSDTNISFEIDGKIFSLREIIKGYLSYLIKQATISIRNNPAFNISTELEGIAITVPAGTSRVKTAAADYARLLFDIVKEITGLDDDRISIIDEPSAAAISYLNKERITGKIHGKSTVLVFDLGGGTLDTSVVSYDPDRHEYSINVGYGDLDLGGNDWDQCLYEYVKREMGLGDLSPSEEFDFRDMIIGLKMRLSDVDEYTAVFEIPSTGEMRSISVSRSTFEEITSELLDRAMDVLQKTINNMDEETLDKIVLVGGSSNMPQIRKRIVDEYSGWISPSNILIDDPSKAISKGAAIHANIKQNTDAPEIEFETIVAPHTYGLTVYRKGSDTKQIINLIFKGDEFGSDRKIRVRLNGTMSVHKSLDEFVDFSVYESDVSRKQCDPRGLINLGNGEKFSNIRIKIPVPSDYKMGNASEFKIIPEIELSENGTIHLHIFDAKTKDKIDYIRGGSFDEKSYQK